MDDSDGPSVRDWLLPLAGATGLLLVLSCYHSTSIPPRALDVPSYIAHLQATGTPLQRDFASGVFRYGDPIEKLLAVHKPTIQKVRGEEQILFFAPMDARNYQGRTVMVLSEAGRLKLAGTRAELRPGELYTITLIPMFQLDGPITADDWQNSWDTAMDQALNLMMGAFGCPAVAAEMRRGGWWPE